MDFNITRRKLMVGGAALMGVAAMPRMALGQSEGETVEAATVYGRVRGKREDGIAKFLGIPYGTPPVGALRFKAPKAPAAWTDVRDTLTFGNPSFQAPQPEMGPERRMPAPSEDCLYLNVWTPAADNRRRPVMFYNHGGGYMIGSGSATGQDGTNLARLHDVVVVQSNHRLGLLGYLFLGDLGGEDYAANAGMLDIQLALQWVRNNIENFGGDPDNVMVWGESGGGAKTACVYTMPGAANLFHKASIESAAPLTLATRDGATERARRTLAALGVAETDLALLTDMPAEKLLEAQQGSDMPMGQAPWAENPETPGFGAFVDGTIIPQNPFAQGVASFSKDKPLMCGTTRDEMVFFSLFGPPDIFNIDDAGLRERLSGTYQGEELESIIATFKGSRPDATPAQIYFAITTSPIVRDSIKIAEAKVEQGGAPVYSYQLAYHSKTKIPGSEFELGSPHASDISMKFNTPETGQDFILGVDQSPERYQTARNMSALWAGFARTGVPHAEGVPEWPAYDLANRSTMWIDAECQVVNDPDKAERLYWVGA
jgi:para-nitrobenzyl esterase